MKLYLVQHGEACAGEVDPQRPLTTQGREDAGRLAVFLGRAGVRVERVIHSGKRRAEQTAGIIGAVVAPAAIPEVSGLINPNDNPAAYDWQSECWDRDTLVVGHLPFLGRLVSDLVTGAQDQPVVAFEPGSVVCLEHAGASRWQIDWMIRPELLPDVTG